MISKARAAAEYRFIHAKTPTMWGVTTIRLCLFIKQYIDEIQPVEILDYGCGKGQQYTDKRVHKLWKTKLPYLYDPYVEGFTKKPSTPEGFFDLVLCCDVMEHVFPDEVDEVLRQLFFYGKKVFLSIGTKPAVKKFSTGDNLHLTIQPEEWWLEKLQKYEGRYKAVFG